MSGTGAHASGHRRPSVALRETCRVVSGRVPLWPYHRARLSAGGCGEDMLAAADAAVTREAPARADAVSSRIRLSVLAAPDGTVTVEVRRRLSSLDVPGGPVAARVDVDTASPPALARTAAKPADRSWWDEAQRRARAAGGDQAVLVSPGGLVLDGGTASVWIAEDGVVLTPPAPAAVAGVARAFLLERLAEAGVPVRVEPFTWERFEAADEAFLTNAFGGCVAVRGRGAELARQAAALLAAVWAD